MAKRRRARDRRANTATLQASEPIAEFFRVEVQRLGRRALFVDTGAIVKCMEPYDTRFRSFFEEEVIGDQLITSAYVVAETLRRIIKAKVKDKLVGPSGQRGMELALHILQGWLIDKDVIVLHVPEIVFATAKASLERNRGTNCDLIDILSFEIVVGLQQRRIVSPDTHFRSLGLDLLPSVN